MEIILWILLVASGLTCYFLFSQRRNNFEFVVESVEDHEGNASVVGYVHSGVVGLSQYVFFRRLNHTVSARVIGIMQNGKLQHLAKKGQRVSLALDGVSPSEIKNGYRLFTNKSRV